MCVCVYLCVCVCVSAPSRYMYEQPMCVRYADEGSFEQLEQQILTLQVFIRIMIHISTHKFPGIVGFYLTYDSRYEHMRTIQSFICLSSMNMSLQSSTIAVYVTRPSIIVYTVSHVVLSWHGFVLFSISSCVLFYTCGYHTFHWLAECPRVAMYRSICAGVYLGWRMICLQQEPTWLSEIHYWPRIW